MLLGFSKEFIEFQNEILGFVSVSWQGKWIADPISWRVVRGMPPYLLLPYPRTPSACGELLDFTQLLTVTWHPGR